MDSDAAKYLEFIPYNCDFNYNNAPKIYIHHKNLIVLLTLVTTETINNYQTALFPYFTCVNCI
jgi:hypothetical protein